MSDVKRQTNRTLRQRQAQATREMIVATAQGLFLERGYTGTTMESIATEAGVAVSTVYAVFGSKRGILRAIREAWHGHSHIREVALGSPGISGPEERINQLAEATRKQWETGSDVMAIYNGASAADPEAAAELIESLEGRKRGLLAFARSLKGNLRSDLDVDHAAAILQALCLPDLYDELVRRSGWSAETYQTWLAEALKRELLPAENKA